MPYGLNDQTWNQAQSYYDADPSRGDPTPHRGFNLFDSSSWFTDTAPAQRQAQQVAQANDKKLNDYLAKGDADRQQSMDWYKGAMQRIQAFADEMAKYDPNDPLAKSLGQVAQSHAMGQAGASGLGGQGISQANAQQAVTNSQMAYQTQRSQMAQQAYGQLQQGALQAAGQQDARNQFAQTFDFNKAQYNEQLRQQAYQSQLQQNQAMPSALLGTFAGYGGDKTYSAWTGAAGGGGMGGMGGGGGGGGAGGGAQVWGNLGNAWGASQTGPYKPTYYGGGNY